MDENVMFDEEVFDLVAGRIKEIAKSSDLKEPYRNYFMSVADWLCEILAYREFMRSDSVEKKDVSVLKQWQERVYAPVLPESYETTFWDPAFAVKEIGKENGGLLSMVAADLTALPVWVAQNRDDLLQIFLELFLQLYGCVEAAETDETEEIRRALSDAVYWFYHDYTEIFAAEGIAQMVAGMDGFISSLIREADLSDLSYLFSYGCYITENEYKLASFLQTLSDEEIRGMADTFTEGYRIGFVTTGKDITKKRTVRIDFPVGMERMVRAAVRNFEKIGLQATFVRQPLISAQSRGVIRRSVFSCAVNRQFMYDHKDDKGYYLDLKAINRRLEVMRDTYETYKKEAAAYGGPAVVEMFGEERFAPVNKEENCRYTQEQNELNVTFATKSGMLTDQYIPGESYSFTIISYPYPSIDKRFEEIFAETVRINNLDYMSYRKMQQNLIDLLDRGAYVRVRGKGDNCTDMTVQLVKLSDPLKETKFENCVADVNIPVGEVFTSPVLQGTEGTLFVSHVCIGDYSFKNLKFTFNDGMVTDYTCDNFEKEEENHKLIFDAIMHGRKTLPIGEFAIGTNTTAYRMAKDFGIFDRLPILIAEKTGPHFAVGDTCYSHAEDVAMFNPDGKEVIARDNACSLLRKSEPDKAYFNCHTDITIPFEELYEITAVGDDGMEYPLIRDGRFVVEGTESLNEPLD